MIDDTAQTWDAHADTFDEAADHGLRDPFVHSALAKLLDGVVGQPSALGADLGCGTGSLSVLLTSAGHQVTGVDFSAGMIRMAQAKAAASGTRAGLTANAASMVHALRANVRIQPLIDPALRGRPINDQRYLLVSTS